MHRPFAGLVMLTLAACASGPSPAPSSAPQAAITPLPPMPPGQGLADAFDGKALRVVLCGTSSPLPDPARAKACTAIIAGDKAYIVDTGPESWEQMARMQFPGARIAGIFLTHFHSDHIGDLGEFRMQTMVAGRDHKLPVYGPHGVKDVVDGFNLAYAEDARLRLAHHGAGVVNLTASPLEAHEFGKAFKGEHTAEEVILNADGLKVTAFEVDHDPIRPAVGYRFDWGGRSVVVSGDTNVVPNLVENSKGADILVTESLASNLVKLGQSQAAAFNARGAKILGDIPSYHISPVNAAKLANEAGVKLLVYSHHIPSAQVGLPLYFAGVADVRPTDQWVVGFDGLRIDLPVNSTEITQAAVLPKP